MDAIFKASDDGQTFAVLGQALRINTESMGVIAQPSE